MRRPTHPDVNGLDTTSRIDRPHGADDRVAGAGPSYVESILFARRPIHRPIPGANPGSTSADKARTALASEASGQRGNSMVRAPDTRPEPGSSARAVLASEASGQRGNSMVRAHRASENASRGEDARERAGDTCPEPGSSARAANEQERN
jgi:hypothetical protein